jgi:hypothetical protein
VLFALARAQAEAWPGDVSRDLLLARAFGARFVDESHRARLRIEIRRLRRLLRGLADISATKRGFAVVSQRGREVVVLARPVEEEHADVLAFCRKRIECPLDRALAGAKRKRQGRARPRLTVCEERNTPAVFANPPRLRESLLRRL